MAMGKRFIVGLLALSHTLFAEEHPVVQPFIIAYNERNLSEMLRYCDEHIRWMWVERDKLSSETSGKTELSEAMRQYFASAHHTRSTVLSWQQSGEFVSVVEQASWPHQGEIRHQCSLAVYQLHEQKILNVWYFPSHTCE